jgi:cytochrome c556
MRRVRTYLAAALVVWAGALVVAQTTQKVTTPAELDKVMKGVNQANGQVNKAIKSAAFADAKTALATLRQHIVLAETFWVEKKKEDAVKFSKAVVGKIDALDKALGATSPDAAAVTAAATELGTACRTCHMEYRARDEATGNWIIRPGKIEGQ